jgi:hypothetical protein
VCHPPQAPPSPRAPYLQPLASSGIDPPCTDGHLAVESVHHQIKLARPPIEHRWGIHDAAALATVEVDRSAPTAPRRRARSRWPWRPLFLTPPHRPDSPSSRCLRRSFAPRCSPGRPRTVCFVVVTANRRWAAWHRIHLPRGSSEECLRSRPTTWFEEGKRRVWAGRRSCLTPAECSPYLVSAGGGGSRAVFV